MFDLFASGHHPPLETGMTTADIISLVQTLGAPMITALACLWFIKYITDQNAKEREKFLERDEANDRRAFELAENCNQAMSKLAQAVEANTKAIGKHRLGVAVFTTVVFSKRWGLVDHKQTFPPGAFADAAQQRKQPKPCKCEIYPDLPAHVLYKHT